MSRTWRRLAWFVLGFLATALFVTVLYALLQGAQTTQAIRDSQKNNHALLNTINDCTKPTGKCFQRGQKRTAGAVASINRVVILAAACAVGKTGNEVEIQAQIQQCVITGLARQHAR
jgi:hypothetical protein